MQLTLKMFKKKYSAFDVTIFQTASLGEKQGYQKVYQTALGGKTHQDVLDLTFSKFNVHDTVPKDYNARFITTGDVVLIDEGKKGKTYYKLSANGWKKISRNLLQTS